MDSRADEAVRVRRQSVWPEGGVTGNAKFAPALFHRFNSSGPREGGKRLEKNELSRRAILAQAGAAGAITAIGAGGGHAKTAPKPKGSAGGGAPDNFLWGVATAAHQYEGNNVSSDLWVLEQLKPSPFREPSGDACDGYHRYDEDIAFIKSLGLNAFRFTVEWARVEPEKGMFSRAHLDFYRRILTRCREAGITPAVTLNHFSAPRWFAEIGAWENPDAPELFARFAERVGKHMGDLIGLAVPFNEPNAPMVAAWLPGGPGAPGAGGTQVDYNSLSDMVKPVLQAAAKSVGSDSFNSFLFGDPKVSQPIMMKAHGMARAALKAGPGTYPVGTILSMNEDHVLPGGEALMEKKRAEVFAPWLEVAQKSDFLGVQCYARGWMGPNGAVKPPANAVVTKSGWAFDPEALGAMLRYASSKVSVPIYVTENGISTDDDAQRVEHIRRAVASMNAAMKDGVDVRGYFHWTLVDNWEWNEGFHQTLGLVAMDRRTFERKPKPSAFFYGKVARGKA